MTLYNSDHPKSFFRIFNQTLYTRQITLKKILIYILFLSTSLHAQVDTNLVEIKNFTINSKTLEKERDYWISLPSDYNPTQSYPVMYVLDANWRFSITNALEKELSENGKVPQHIVVGITCPNRRFNMSFSRSKVNCAGETDTIAFSSDNSGNGQKFLTFIEDELMKEVNQKYSTSGFNILIGHSLGGYFCTYILPLQKSFNSLQIYDPSIWYNKGEAIQQIDSSLSQNTVCHIFTSSSSKYESRCAYHYKKIEELNQSLNRFPNIHSEYKTYENENHNSMYLHSFLDGMSMLYDGYELKKGGSETIISSSIIDEHYKLFSKKIQFEFSPPIRIYLEVGKLHFFQKEYKKCIEALETYLEKTSENEYAFEIIGDAYVLTGKNKQGLHSYLQAYELSPDNTRLNKKIEALKN